MFDSSTDPYDHMLHYNQAMTLNVKPEKNSIFLEKGKTVIAVENQKFSRSRMTKWTASLYLSREI